MRRSNDRWLAGVRVVLVGTGTGVGKTHVACALLSYWADRLEVVGLKPVETGVSAHKPVRGGGAHSRRLQMLGATLPSDQQRLADAARMFHVKRRGRAGGAVGGIMDSPAPRVFHVKRHDQEPTSETSHSPPPFRSLYAFPDPISPHLAARQAQTRIDLGAIERWVRSHEASVTVIETAGGLFSPLGHGTTNFDLTQTLRPHAVVLVAPDRLGVLHELTTTLALAAVHGGPPLGVVLSSPAKRDASTGRNAEELIALGITRPIALFPRAGTRAPTSLDAARRVIAWIEACAHAAMNRGETR